MSIAEILSQDEITQLLTKVEQDDAAILATNPEDIQDYDLTQRYTKKIENIQFIETVNDLCRKELITRISAFLSRKPQLDYHNSETRRLNEYLSSLPKPCVISQVQIPTLKGSMLISLSPEFISDIIETLFGGNVNNSTNSERDFGKIEIRVAELIIEQIVICLQTAWKVIDELTFEPCKLITNPSLVNCIEPDAKVITSHFSMNLGHKDNDIYFCMPYELLLPLQQALQEKSEETSKNSETQLLKQQLQENLHNVYIPLTCVVSHAEIKLSEMLKLKVGDIITIENPEKTAIYGGNTHLFNGRSGIHDGWRAIKISERTDEL